MSVENPALTQEYLALLSCYAQAQDLSTALTRHHAQEVEQLQTEVFKLRAKLINRETALAWEREARMAALLQLHALSPPPSATRAPQPRVQATTDGAVAPMDPPDALEHSLRAADLVICQTGCIGHGAYWRVEDHCRRTGTPCLLVEQPRSLRIVRIHSTEPADGSQEPSHT